MVAVGTSLTARPYRDLSDGSLLMCIDNASKLGEDELVHENSQMDGRCIDRRAI